MEQIKRKNNNGITLVALVITMLILIIIAGIGINSGIESTNNIKLKKFNDELQLIQARVDLLYSKKLAGEKTDEDLGGDTYQNMKFVMDRTFDAIGVNTNRGDFKYYTKQSLKRYLDIEDIDQSVMINWNTREVISVEGIKIAGERYYKYTGYTYVPEYNNTKKSIAVNLVKEENGDIIRVIANVTDTESGETISEFTLKYKLEDETTWKIASSNYFETLISGNYDVQISGNQINTNNSEIIVNNVNLYQRVEYIQSTGTQYINTRYIPNSSTEIEATVSFTESSSDLQQFGCIANVGTSSSAQYARWHFGVYQNKLCCFRTTASSSGDVKLDFDSNFHDYYISNTTAKLDNTTNVPSSTRNSSTEFTLFARNGYTAYGESATVGNYAKAKLKSFKIYENSELKINLIPCYRVTDGEIGLYDSVNNNFYTKLGTGAFIKGNNI